MILVFGATGNIGGTVVRRARSSWVGGAGGRAPAGAGEACRSRRRSGLPATSPMSPPCEPSLAGVDAEFLMSG